MLGVLIPSVPPLPIAVGVALAALVAFVVAVRLIRGWGDSERRQCPECRYDMFGVRGLRCPECGHVSRSANALYGRRRSVRAGLCVLAAGFVVLVSGAYWNQRVAIYYAIMPTWKLVATVHAANAEVRHYVKRNPDDFGERMSVRVAGQLPVEIEDYKLTLGAGMRTQFTPIGIGEDVTGEGVPDLAIMAFSGGAHCCETLHLIELGEVPRQIAKVDLANGGALVPTSTPGVAELATADWTFTYWNASYVASPKPRVFLRWRDGAFRFFQSEAERTAALSEAELAALAAELRETPRPDIGGLDPRVWGTAINLIYAGRYERGIAFIREAWPAPRAGDGRVSVEAFLAEFIATVEKSPYWQEIRAIKPPAEPAIAPGLETP